MFYEYVDSGSWSGSTYHANEDDLQAIKFRQRVAIDVSQRDTTMEMLGETVTMPVALAPTGLNAAICRWRNSGGQGGGGFWCAIYPINHVDLFD